MANTKEYSRAWRKKNYEKSVQYQHEYRLKTKEKQKEYNKRAYERRKLRYANDINFKLASRLRNRLNMALRKDSKAGSAVSDLGCSIDNLKKHLESKFQPGMTWDNWTVDGWHIDHIIPLSSFNLTDPVEFKKACHYTNLQPLWWKQNLDKR